MKIQHGKHLKTESTATIPFPHPFQHVPTVVVSSHWQNQGSEVGHTETIDTITPVEFTVVSGNAAPNYFIQWIAISNEATAG
jgi:hypothetical protein